MKFILVLFRSPWVKVEKLLLNVNRVTGVAVRDPAGSRKIEAREVILSCGAIHSPALLQRSGIGPGEALRNLNVPVVADRRGVGRNLIYHPIASLNAHVRGKGRPKDTSEPTCVVVARYSSTVRSDRRRVGNKCFRTCRSRW